MIAKKCPILQLPLLPLQRILELIHFIDIFALSLTSKTMKNRIKNVRIEVFAYGLECLDKDKVSILVLDSRFLPKLKFELDLNVMDAVCDRHFVLNGLPIGVVSWDYKDSCIKCSTRPRISHGLSLSVPLILSARQIIAHSLIPLPTETPWPRGLQRLFQNLDVTATALLDYCSSVFPAKTSKVQVDVDLSHMVSKTLNHPVFSTSHFWMVTGKDPYHSDGKNVVQALKTAEIVSMQIKLQLQEEIDHVLTQKRVAMAYSHYVTLADLLNMKCETAHFLNSRITSSDLNVFFHAWLNKTLKTNLKHLRVDRSSYSDNDSLLRGLDVLEFDETRQRRPVFYGTPHLQVLNCEQVYDIIRSDGVLATIGVAYDDVFFMVWP